MARARILGLVALCALLALAAPAGATPYISLHTFQEWDQAYRNDRIVGVAPLTLAQMMDDMIPGPQGPEYAWPEVYRQAGLARPELVVVPAHADHTGRTHPALEMRWRPDPDFPGTNERVIAAWDFVYPLDPDLRGLPLEFSIHTFPCMFFSLNILDANGNYREWIWHSWDPRFGPDPFPTLDPAGLPLPEVPPCTWTTIVVDPVTGSSNYAPFALFTVDQPGIPFDLSQVTMLRFDENGRWGDPNQMDPTGQWLWNAWDHVDVTPEPTTMLLLGGGLLGLLARRKRNRR